MQTGHRPYFGHGYRLKGSSGDSSIFFRAFMATLWGRARSSIRLTALFYGEVSKYHRFLSS